MSMNYSIPGDGYTAHVLDMTSQQWRAAREVDKPLWRHWLANAALRVSNDQERLIIATGRYIGEGFDDARLDTLFFGSSAVICSEGDERLNWAYNADKMLNPDASQAHDALAASIINRYRFMGLRASG